MESLGNRRREKKETPWINPQGLILSDNLRKPHRHSKEMIHLTKDFQVRGWGVGWGDNPAPAVLLS